jgi:hypothetical protein
MSAIPTKPLNVWNFAGFEQFYGLFQNPDQSSETPKLQKSRRGESGNFQTRNGGS